MNTILRIFAAILLGVFLAANSALAAQQVDSPPAPAPLPDVATLLRSVEANQEALDRAREEYTFRQQQRLTFYDKHGKAGKNEERVSNVFFVHGQPIETLISKNGKPLNASDLKKEQDRAAKEAVKYAAQPYGQRDKDDVSVSRLLAITRFSDPRRITEGGRSVIAVDFTGDPHAKTHGRSEDAVKKVRGTVWIDEAAREVTRMHATFDEPMRIGFGLFATVNAGSNFSFEQALIRDEAWLPTKMDARFDGKAALFVGFHVEAGHPLRPISEVQRQHDGAYRDHSVMEAAAATELRIAVREETPSPLPLRESTAQAFCFVWLNCSPDG